MFTAVRHRVRVEFYDFYGGGKNYRKEIITSFCNRLLTNNVRNDDVYGSILEIQGSLPLSVSMAKFERFEEILSWQKARRLTKRTYEVTAEGAFSRDFGLRDQLRRAVVSIMANIAEGFGRRSNKDFANFLVIAHASAAEAQSHLYVALDLAYISEEVFFEIYRDLDETSRLIMALTLHLRKTA